MAVTKHLKLLGSQWQRNGGSGAVEVYYASGSKKGKLQCFLVGGGGSGGLTILVLMCDFGVYSFLSGPNIIFQKFLEQFIVLITIPHERVTIRFSHLQLRTLADIK